MPRLKASSCIILLRIRLLQQLPKGPSDHLVGGKEEERKSERARERARERERERERERDVEPGDGMCACVRMGERKKSVYVCMCKIDLSIGWISIISFSVSTSNLPPLPTPPPFFPSTFLSSPALPRIPHLQAGRRVQLRRSPRRNRDSKGGGCCMPMRFIRGHMDMHSHRVM